MKKYLRAAAVCVHGFDAEGRPIWYTYNEGLDFKGTPLIPAGAADQFGSTWRAELAHPYYRAHSLRAHKRGPSTNHQHPNGWACRPIRGRAPDNSPDWIPGPEKYVRQIVVSCLMCGDETYLDVSPAQYQAMLSRRVQVLIAPCVRCGSRRSWEPFILITAVPERVFSTAYGSAA